MAKEQFQDERPTFFIDWGHAEKLAGCGLTGEAFFIPQGLPSFMREHAGCRQIIESAFGWAQKEKAAIIDLAHSLDIDFRQHKSTQTRRVARELGINVYEGKTKKPRALMPKWLITGDTADTKWVEENTDLIDTYVMRYITLHTNKHLSRPRVPEEMVVKTHLETACALRNSKWPPGPVAEYLAYLPPADDAPEHFKYCFCEQISVEDGVREVVKGRGQNKRVELVPNKKRVWAYLPIVVTLVAAARDVLDGNRINGQKQTKKPSDEFGRALGVYQEGYPSFARACLHHDRLPVIYRKEGGTFELNERGGAKKELRDKPIKNRSLSKMRRASRWVLSQVKRSYVKGPLNPQ